MQYFSNYINELQKQNVTEITEHSHRAALQTLLNGVANDISTQQTNILHEPRRQGKNGSPDFMISTQAGIIGYVENKKITQNLNETIVSEQIEKYKKLTNNLLITNYVEFIWLKGEEVFRETLCEMTDIQSKSTFELNPINVDKVYQLIKKFLTQPPRGIADIETLAHTLAERARYLFVILSDYLLEQEQNEDLQDEIWGTYQAFVNTVYEDLTVEGFTDTFAQTLTYGLFLAKLNIKTNEQINLHTIELQIPSSFALVKNIVSLLKYIKKDRYSKALWIVEELLSIINNVDILAIQESLSFTNRKKLSENYQLSESSKLSESSEYKDPYIYFYEHFLSEYNPKLRKSRGVYYTPHSVVRFIISAIDEVLKDKQLFAIKNGIADTEKVNFLDFATGTGTFLLEIFEQLNERKPFNKPDGNNLIKKHLQNIYGFEFLIAPYVIAHLKLTQYLKENGVDIHDRLNIYLTNTLEDKEPQRSLFVPELSAEGKLAQKVKRTDKILVITGNPPYSGNSENVSFSTKKVMKTYKSGKQREVTKKFDTWIGRLMKDYYKVDNVPISEANPKWLQDDYVKFIRFAQYKIEHTGEGIVAIITNHAFLDNPTFRGMRYSLMQTFDQMYIIDLHGNSKKKEKTPENEKDENVFDIQQGVCISILIKKKGLEKCVKRADFWGKREQKNKQLNETEWNTIQWEGLQPSEPFYLFSYQNLDVKEQYNSWISVNQIFDINSVGIVTARDKLAIQFTENEINKVVNEFVKLSVDEARRKFDLGDDVRDWSVQMAQDDVKKSGIKPENFKKILYRPFDVRFTYYTGNSRGFQCMPRKTVMSNFANENMGLITVRRSRSSDIWNLAFISNHLVSGSTAISSLDINYVYPIYRYIPKGLLSNPEKAQRKISEIEKEFLQLHKEFKELLADKEKNKNRLDELAQEEYNALMEEKETLYELKKKQFEKAKKEAIQTQYEKIENINVNFRSFIDKKYNKIYSPEQILGYIYAILHSPTYREKYSDFLKTDFPRIPFCDNSEDFEKISNMGAELVKVHLMHEIPEYDIADTYDGVVGNNTVEKIEFREVENVGRIYINKTNYFEPIPAEIVDFQIGGYKVIDKYLKERKGKDLHTDEIEHVKNMAKIIAFTMDKMEEIDSALIELI